MSKLRPVFTVLLVMLLLVSAASSGQTDAATTEGYPEDTLEVVERPIRRVLTDIEDYDYGGSNPKHDPHRKPGNGHSR